MHELAITQEIVALACERAAGAKVRRIVIEIGRLSAVLPDAVRFCFSMCAEDTVAEGATLDIIEVDGEARCRKCANTVKLTRPFGLCTCGNSDLEWLSGEQLSVVMMEVA